MPFFVCHILLLALFDTSLNIAHNAAALGRKWLYRPKKIVVPIDRCLLGHMHGVDGAKFGRLIDDYLWPSTPISKSPHVRFLEGYLEKGEALFEPANFRRTAYFRIANLCIDIFGSYFEAKCEDEVRKIARGFVNRFQGVRDFGSDHPSHSRGGMPVMVQPVQYSDCYQVIDGHHRLAIAYVRGEKETRVLCQGKPMLTLLQSLLLDVLWLNGKREIYQPIDSPELGDDWVRVRKCVDRMTMLREFLARMDLMPPKCATYIDIAMSYGWFVAEMRKLGFEVRGVEADPIALSVGQLVYGLQKSDAVRSECIRFLEEQKITYDITSCFSLLHHFVLGKGRRSAEELIGHIDRITGKVLFLDTGQSNEQWFQESLADWDPDYIEGWIRNHTSFKRIYRLGVDRDRVPPFERNYSRTLFACTR